MKIVLNKDFGGFSLTNMAYERLIELGMKVINQNDNRESADIIKFSDGHYMFIDDNNHKYRTDKRLIQTVEELGTKASHGGSVKVVEIPMIDEYYIHCNDGFERIEVCPKCNVDE